MPRLLRIHFASIGHRDARLAPLTIDLRDQDGRATDSVLWLRNGGGKSSIINLFFSIFRPHRNEFLGAAAEGKARRIEDYVKAKDVAVAVTEWDLGNNSAGQPQRCVVGRLLSWKGQTRSSDPSNLRRLFFTLSSPASIEPKDANAAVFAFDNLPVSGLSGLGEPAPTFDAFRDWLRELASAHPAAQVVYTDNQRKWNELLERLGLDPELFRYQIRMNLREGAADEAFRFGTALDFIHFLLELAFETRHADQIAKNLEELRDQLARRPELELERAFLVDALAALNPLVEAVRTYEETQKARDRCLAELGGIAQSLHLRAATADEEAATAISAAKEAAEEARTAGNERDKRNRWARGLDHLAAKLEVQERQAHLADIEAQRSANNNELKELRAALLRRNLNRLDAELSELRESLQRAQEKLAPEKQRLEAAGSALRYALTIEQQRLGDLLEDIIERIEVASNTCAEKQRYIDELRAESARLGERIAGCRRTIKRRDTARDKLQNDGYLDAREDAEAARKRWGGKHAEAIERHDALQEERIQVVQRLEQNQDRQRTVTGDLARYRAEFTVADQRLLEALQWRQSLAQNQCITEIEAVDEADLESPGLEQRLRAEAATAAAEILQARVDGAEGERALSGIEETGLLPPTRDVERVVARLRKRTINAHAGANFLAETTELTKRLDAIISAPARYGGVLVSAAHLPADIGAVTADLELRSPVQISAVSQDHVDENRSDAECHVVPPHPAAYDHTRAEAVRINLQEQQERRNRRIDDLQKRRRNYERTADELHRYIEELGRGKLDALHEDRKAAAEQAEQAEAELAQLAEDEELLRNKLDNLDEQIKQSNADIGAATLAIAALQQFWTEHEAEIESVRIELESSEKRQRQAEHELNHRALIELEQEQARLEVLKDERKDRDRDRKTISTEIEEVAYVADGAEPAKVRLDHARDRYRHLLADWEKRTSDNRLQWQIEEKTKDAKPLREELANRLSELDPARIGEIATQPDLEKRITGAEHIDDQLRDRRANASADLKQAQRELEASKRRREAQDLPPATDEQPTPTTAAAAREAAEDTRARLQEYTDAARKAEEREKQHRTRSDQCHQASERFRSSADKLSALVDGAGLSLAQQAPVSIPDDFAAIDNVLENARSSFKEVRTHLANAENDLRVQSDAVRAVATAPRFSDLRSQARERMNAETDELIADCDRLATRLKPRLDVIDERLTEIDKDRKILIDALQTVGAEAGRLLQRAQRASTLPASLGIWAGKPYLRIRFQFPETDEEQRARLEPLVDRLVQKAQIPNGLNLVKQAVAELAGTRGFEAKVLKPDAVLRPEPVSITAVNTFSRGQQLTVAILLYCTLVQLRARSRGRGTGSADAGILVLDNPIGTCSSVPLLELQRTIAREMRVQLIYATGVDDLEALETLPNKVRLRNTMRDRNTGDFHVTHEARVEAVRIATIGG